MIKVIKKLDKFKSILECVNCQTQYTTNHYDAKKSPVGHLCSMCKDPSTQPLSQALLHKFYHYDPVTGVMSCKLPHNNRKVGEPIGFKSSQGYMTASIGGKNYLLHRIIWLYQKGYLPDQVDHIDHDRTNNIWSNLREVNNETNSKNCTVSTNSTTKINGVSYIPSRNKYRAYINHKGKQIHLGLFNTIEEAASKRQQADIDYGYHPNHGLC